MPAVLAVYDWPADTDRFNRVSRLVDYIIDRFPRLQTEAGYHPKWKDVNLAGTVPGWQRFAPMEAKLKQITSAIKQPPARRRRRGARRSITHWRAPRPRAPHRTIRASRSVSSSSSSNGPSSGRIDRIGPALRDRMRRPIRVAAKGAT